MRERAEGRGISIQSGLHVNNRTRTLFFFSIPYFSPFFFFSSMILLRVISNRHQRFVGLEIKSSEKSKTGGRGKQKNIIPHVTSVLGKYIVSFPSFRFLHSQYSNL